MNVQKAYIKKRTRFKNHNKQTEGNKQMNIDKINRDRKLTASDKKELRVVMGRSTHRLRVAAEAKADCERQTAQQAWEESIGAAKIREKIKQNCAEANELNTQLMERGCEPVDARERVNSTYRSSRKEVQINLKGEQLKEYKKHQAKMKEIDDAVGDAAEDHYEAVTILYIETVGDAIDLLGSHAPQLLGIKPILLEENV
tara:strand:+ start:213 stop:812 length:600 start_codon:yes stop_codon:yes gene_type:complete